MPIVTMSGRTMVSRMGGSILSSVNFEKLICLDYYTYIQKIKEISKLAPVFKCNINNFSIDSVNAHDYLTHLKSWDRK